LDFYYCLREDKVSWVVLRNFLKSTDKIYFIVFWLLVFKAMNRAGGLDQIQTSFCVTQVTLTGQARIKNFRR